MLVSYTLEIKHEIITIYTMKRILKFDRVDIESKEFSLAGSAQRMKNTFYSIIDDLSQTFLMIALEFSPCTFATVKYFQQAGYTDSKVRNCGKSVALHENCWHLHDSAFERYTLDVESVREEYKGFEDDDDDDDDNDYHGDGDRQKLLHLIGHVKCKETDVTHGGNSATSGKSATQKYPTTGKSTKAAMGGKSSTGGKQSTGGTAATHQCSNRSKKNVNYEHMPELEDDFDD